MEIAGIFLILWLSIFLHEIGHLIAARIVGIPIAIVMMGRTPIFHFKLFGSTFAFGYPWQLMGWVLPRPQGLMPRPASKFIFYTSGGMVVNATLAIIGGILWHQEPSSWIYRFLCLLNSLLVVTSAFPMRAKVQGVAVVANDGGLILDVWKHGFIRSPGPGTQLGMLQSLVTLCQSLDEDKLAKTIELVGVFRLAELSGLSQAQQKLDELEAGMRDDPLWHLANAILASERNDKDAGTKLETAKAKVTEFPKEALLLRSIEAFWRAKNGEDSSAEWKSLLAEAKSQKSRQLEWAVRTMALLLQSTAEDRPRLRLLIDETAPFNDFQLYRLQLWLRLAKLSERGSPEQDEAVDEAIKLIRTVMVAVPSPETQEAFQKEYRTKLVELLSPDELADRWIKEKNAVHSTPQVSRVASLLLLLLSGLLLAALIGAVVVTVNALMRLDDDEVYLKLIEKNAGLAMLGGGITLILIAAVSIIFRGRLPYRLTGLLVTAALVMGIGSLAYWSVKDRRSRTNDREEMIDDSLFEDDADQLPAGEGPNVDDMNR
jgi:hypothetical protein